MIQTLKYNISVVLDDDLGRILEVYSAFTGRKLGTCPYNSIVECYSHPDEIDDYVNSNMKFS
jgi:hypothetical protein